MTTQQTGQPAPGPAVTGHAYVPAAPRGRRASSRPARPRRQHSVKAKWLWLTVLALALIGLTHGLILIPAVVVAAAVSVRKGRIGKVPAMAAAFGLIVLIITISVTTWSHGSKVPAVSSQPKLHHSAPLVPVPKSSPSSPSSATPSSPAPVHSSPAPVQTQPVARPSSPAPVQTTQQATQPAATSYRAGEFCSVHGATSVDAHGNPIVCADKNGWRWEH
jgi:hypothetical protein